MAGSSVETELSWVSMSLACHTIPAAAMAGMAAALEEPVDTGTRGRAAGRNRAVSHFVYQSHAQVSRGAGSCRNCRCARFALLRA